MPLRFVDLDAQPSGYADFSGRKRSPTLVEQFYFCLTLILAGTVIVLLIHDPGALIALLFVVIGLAATYVTRQTHHNRQLVRATEFQNALFASVMSQGSLFCLITSKDGRIVYGTPGFRALFPGMKNGNSVQDWLAVQQVPPDTRSSILEGIHSGSAGQMPLTVHAADQQKHSLLLSIEPIERPAGFVLLRGRQT